MVAFKRITNNFMERSPSWAAISCAATQELLSILLNLDVNYCVHKSPPLVYILRHVSPGHTTLSYLSKIHLNIIYPFMSCSSYGLFPSGFPISALYAFLLFSNRATCSAHLNFSDVIILIIIGEEYKSSYEACSQTPWFCVHPLMSETNFHTMQQHRQHYIYILIFMLLDSKQEEKSFWTEW
jgi:hypothetical protein